MQFKKSNGNIFGVTLNAKEQKALDKELQRQSEEYTRKLEREFESVFLWEQHVQLGHGKVKLKRFYKGFKAAIDALIARYEFDDADKIWLCTQQLKDIGADIEEWEKEEENE
jgi:hypothetical protein